jgi:ADP-ribose pyrophosphatase YjhB (NUDIX family)
VSPGELASKPYNGAGYSSLDWRGAPVVFLYQALKKVVGIFFNGLNALMLGNLPPFVCVGVIIEEQNRFLVIRRTDGRLVFPGGFIRWREHPVQAAHRECYEETGLNIRIGPIIGYYPYVGRGVTHISTVNLAFTAEVVGGTLRESIEGRPLWLSEHELRNRLIPGSAGMLDDYLRYRSTERP